MRTNDTIQLLAGTLKKEGIKGFMRDAVHYLSQSLISRTQFILLPLVIKDIKKSTGPWELAHAVSYVFEGFGRLAIKPWQIRSEIEEFLKLVEDLAPRNIIEIGTANGGTLFLLTRAASVGARFISIDLPEGRFGGGYSAERGEYYGSFALPSQQIDLLRMDSHLDSTQELVKQLLGKEELDLLFIDGDHTYDGVKKDYEMYASLVRQGGIIAFHDIAPQAPETGCEVKKYWDEIKGKYESRELLDHTDQWGFGIGVIFKQ